MSGRTGTAFEKLPPRPPHPCSPGNISQASGVVLQQARGRPRQAQGSGATAGAAQPTDGRARHQRLLTEEHSTASLDASHLKQSFLDSTAEFQEIQETEGHAKRHLRRAARKSRLWRLCGIHSWLLQQIKGSHPKRDG